MIVYIVGNPEYFKFILSMLLIVTTLLCFKFVHHYPQTSKLEKLLLAINLELLFKKKLFMIRE